MANSTRRVTKLGPNASSLSESVVFASDMPPLNAGSVGSFATPVSVTATATQVKAANAKRLKIIVTNSIASTARMYLGADNTVTAGAAGKNFAYLDPGDSWEESTYTGAVYAICDAGLSASAKYLEVAQA